MQRDNKIRKCRVQLCILTYLLIYALMLACNVMSRWACDDFRYMFSFLDYGRIDSLYDIFMSMRAHRYHMNGRLVTHTLVQLFSMAPLWVFDLLNAGMFVLQLALLHKFSRAAEGQSNAVLVLLFCAAWIFCPVFGQVNLWQDGAFNYLWGAVLALLFLQPFVDDYQTQKTFRNGFDRICFLGLSFAMGAYSETSSAAAIFMAALLVLLMLLEKRKMRRIWWSSLIVATLGYLSIYTAPAQWWQKSAEMKTTVLTENFVNVLLAYWNLLDGLLVAFALLLVGCLLVKAPRRQILLGLVFFAGSVAANMIMMFAQYYAPRSAFSAFVFLLGADGILLYPLVKKCPRKLVAVVVAAVLLITAGPLHSGLQDIVTTYRKMRENEAYILECRDEGILDVEIPLIAVKTKYSLLYGMQYLNTESAEAAPNYSMSDYYGINSLIGVDPD